MVSSPRALYRGVTWQAIITPVRAVPTVCGPRLSEPAEPGTTTRTIRERGRVASWSPPGTLCSSRSSPDSSHQSCAPGSCSTSHVRCEKKSCTSRTSRAPTVLLPCSRSPGRSFPRKRRTGGTPRGYSRWCCRTAATSRVTQAGCARRRTCCGRSGITRPRPMSWRRASSSRLACWHLTRRASLALMRRLRSLRRPRRRPARPRRRWRLSAPMPSVSRSPPGSGAAATPTTPARSSRRSARRSP